MGFRDEVRSIIDAAGQRPDAERLHQLFDASWRNDMAESPESATFLAQRGHNHRWTDWSPDAVARRRADAGLTLEAIRTIDRSALDEGDALSHDVFAHLAADAAAAADFPHHLLPVNQLEGPQVDVPFVLSAMPATTRQHVDDILARLRAVPTLVDQTIALLDQGRAQGVTAPAVTLRDVPAQIDATIGDEPLESPLLTPLRALPDHFAPAEKDQILAEAARVVTEVVAPAFRRLRDHLTETYIPKARESVGLGQLPDGDDWYAQRVHHFTTIDVSPEELHHVGQTEVDRITAEMAALRDELRFEGSADDFAAALAADDRFTFATPEALLASYRDIAKRIDATVLRLFRTIPRLPFAVVPVPAEQAPSAPVAFYLMGSLDDARPGQFYANTSNLAARPAWNMESICLHEAVPGHHFQLTLAQELEGVPTFRKHAGFTAYLEGWGLYCESLGPELGLYTDPYQRYGALDAEILRAIRLVLDTGLHALGWSRDQAIDYFVAHSATPRHEIVTEVDRYIVLPGQALAYKAGELKLQALRAKASAALGDRFDVRELHDQFLRHGALPLGLLESLVDRWIDEHPDGDGASNS